MFLPFDFVHRYRRRRCSRVVGPWTSTVHCLDTVYPRKVFARLLPMGLDEAPSTAGPKPDKPVKKRASQACHHCRTRKVKCDLVKSGNPCHNCSADGIECVITESRRSRKYRLQKRQLNRTTSIPLLPQTLPGPPAHTPQLSSHVFSPPSTLPPAVSAPRSQSSHGKAHPGSFLVLENLCN